MQKGMQILHPFLVVHLAAHVSNTNIRRFRRIRFRRHCIRHRRRISQQQSFPPPLHPHPLLFPQKDPFPQQERRRMIQIIELHPHPLSVEHPQFVAVKSLISDLQINIFTV